jgi:NADH:ubiquinone oxidoreductase subunit 2 (subunit N)
MLKRINDGLPCLIVGILIYGIVIQLAGVWFVEDKGAYSIGLWYGVAMAIGMAIHMAVVIYDAVTLDGEERAQKRVAAKSMLRYLIVAILLGVFVFFKLGNVFMAFIGLMSLKISAYLWPTLTRISHRDKNQNLLSKETQSSTQEEVTM